MKKIKIADEKELKNISLGISKETWSFLKKASVDQDMAFKNLVNIILDNYREKNKKTKK